MLKINAIAIPGLEAVSLTINQGECIGLSGASGCGKTRLLRAIADLDAHAGDVCLHDCGWRDQAAHQWRRRVAYLPAESQWWHDTVQPHFPETMLDFAALGFSAEVLQWEIARCSSGEKQRLAVLRALLNQPEVLLLDEPTANLDASNSRKVEQLIADYIAQHQAMALWVSHNDDQLQRMCTQRYQISNGALVQCEHKP